MVAAAQCFDLFACSTGHRDLGRAGADPRRRRAALEAAGQVGTVRRVRSRAHLFPLGGAGSRSRPASAGRVPRAGNCHGRLRRPACIFPPGPRMAFHGNMQVAIAEARTLVEAGNRVVFFVDSTGEVERVADIFNEYGVAYQLGLEQTECHAGVSGRARLHGRIGGEHLSWSRATSPRGTVFRDREAGHLRLRRSVRRLRAGGASRRSQDRT